MAANTKVVLENLVDGYLTVASQVRTTNGNTVQVELDKKVEQVEGSSLVPDDKVSSYDSHLTNKNNPHGVTAEQVGLGNVVNTGDSATPVVNGTDKFTTGGAYTELAKKVDKEEGKSLVEDTKVTSYDNHLTNTSNPHKVTASQVGLGNVANTGDSATPVSGGTTKFTTGGAYTELNKKVDKVTGSSLVPDSKVSSYDSHLTNTNNPHSVTKSQVGLGSVVNTGDSATPVSGGTTKFTTGGAYTELNKKVDKVDGSSLVPDTKVSSYDSHIANTNNPHQVTALQLGLDKVVNTGDSNTPVENGTTKFTTGGAYTELNKKVDKVTGSSLVADTKVASYDAHLTNTSNPHSVTKSQVGLSNVQNKSLDTTVTANSGNYITSGAVKSYVDTNGGKIDTISVEDVQKEISSTKNVNLTLSDFGIKKVSYSEYVTPETETEITTIVKNAMAENIYSAEDVDRLYDSL